MGIEDRDYYREKRQTVEEQYDKPNKEPLRRDKFPIWRVIIVVTLIVWVTIFLMFYIIPIAMVRSILDPVEKVFFKEEQKVFNIPKTSNVPHLNTSDNQLFEQPLPKNGSSKILYPAENYVVLLTVKSETNNHYLIKLVDKSDKPILYLFVRANNSANIKAPYGKYKLEWISGKKWFGYDNMFGNSSTFHSLKQPLDFHEQNISVNGKTVIMNNIVTFNAMTGDMPLISVKPIYLK
jgi:hypothetical protein